MTTAQPGTAGCAYCPGGACPRCVARRLDAAYARIPDIECKGLCADSCWSYAIGPAERRHVHTATGVRLPPLLVGEPCPALDQAAGRCRVHEHRPAICRLYGATEGLECPWGCQSVGGLLLSRAEGHAALDAVEETS